MNTTAKLTLIYGSKRPGRFCDTVAQWVLDQLAKANLFEVLVLDPLQLDLGSPKDRRLVSETLNDSDAILMITPEYNHSFPAALKEIIDSCNTEWHVKPVAFVSYGGGSGGIRAVEQLRQVFVELHAVPIRASLSFPNVWGWFDDSGQLLNPAKPEQRFSALLAQLHWWTLALRSARNESSVNYQEVA